MIIEHESFINLVNKDLDIFNRIFGDTLTLSRLSGKIARASAEMFEMYNYPDDNKMKGDLFEIFAEAFFKLLASDNRIGVYNYSPAPSVDDYGVDGIGIGMDEKPLTVQIKYRSDSTLNLVGDDIKQFPLQSMINYGVDMNTRTNMVVFTNAKGLHWVTESRVFAGRVRTIGYDEITRLVNNNTVFWRNLNDVINNTIRVKYGITEE